MTHAPARQHAVPGCAAAPLDVGEVGVALAQRRRHRDHGHVEACQVPGSAVGSIAAGCASAACSRSAGDILDERFAGLQLADPLLVEVEADDVEALLDGTHSQRKAHVALPDHDHLAGEALLVLTVPSSCCVEAMSGLAAMAANVAHVRPAACQFLGDAGPGLRSGSALSSSPVGPASSGAICVGFSGSGTGSRA